MAEHTLVRNRFFLGLAYASLMCLLLIINLLPFEVWPRKFPGPDLMVAITFAWLLRRPGHIPAPLVAAVFFVADILLMRPLGLWAALMVVAAEFLKTRLANVRERAFVAEWALISGTLLAATLANAAILLVVSFEQEQVQLDKSIIQAFSTILAYPLVTAIARYVFGVTTLGANDIYVRKEKA